MSDAPVQTGREGPAGRADLPVGLDAWQRVSTGFMAHAAWTRRRFLAGLAVVSAAPLGFAAEKNPVTLAAAFDKAVEEFMKERSVPGGALAVARNGKLVYARGYGWADREAKTAAKPDSLFRIASLSKPITGVAVLKLVEDGKLNLDAQVFELLVLGAQLPEDATLDDRWKRITLRHLLHHTAGWDRDKSGDPMFKSREISKTLGEEPPATPAQIIRWMLRKPLDFDPGTRYAYSNFGYCLLGRVIEKVTGQAYEKFVQQSVLAAAGVRRMRLGASLERGHAEGEVRYYTAAESKTASVFTGSKDSASQPYGGFFLEAMDAHGGWIGSAVDLVRFATALDDPRRNPLKKPESLRLLFEAPADPVAREADGRLKDHWYACGWQVRPVRDGAANHWHNGSLPGTCTLLVRRWDGIAFAALFNQRSDNWPRGDDALDPALNRAADSVTEWPEQDLFGKWE
jgi:N-acyl-D-amino-acid deacylase